MKRRSRKLRKPTKENQHFSSSELQDMNGGLTETPPKSGISFADQIAGSGSGIVQMKDSDVSNSIPGVSIHEDSSLAGKLGAHAFTQGTEIHFAPGQYNPDTRQGKELIGHELGHVVQQQKGNVRPTTKQNGFSINDDPGLEKEADDFGQSFANSPSKSGIGSSAANASVTQLCSAQSPMQFYVPVAEGTQINWGNATEATPSSEGVKGGVFFIKVAGVTHVVKASENVASTIFAEEMLSQVAGATTGGSIPVKAASAEGQQILDQIARFVPQEEGMDQAIYLQKQANFQASSYFLIQNMIAGTKMGSKSKFAEQDIQQAQAGQHVAQQIGFLQNAALLRNIGKAFAADTLIGNADRFEEMNTGNAFVMAGNAIGAIDTEALLQGYNEYNAWVEAEKEGYAVGYEKGSSGWVDFLTEGREISNVGAAAPSSRVARVFGSFDQWFRSNFINAFQPGGAADDHPLKQAYDAAGFYQWDDNRFGASLANGAWSVVKAHIKAGIDEAVQTIVQQTSGDNLTALKDRFLGLKAQFAQDDPNFDVKAFEARANMMQGLAAGRSMDNIKADIISQVELNNLVSVDDSKLVVPARPKKRGKLETARRKREQRQTSGSVGVYESEAEQRAQRLKEMARGGGGVTDIGLLAQVESQEEGDVLKSQKAVFEARLRMFKDYMAEKTGILNFLIPDIKKAKLARGGDEQDPEVAAAVSKLAEYESKEAGINTIEGAISLAYSDFYAKLKPESKLRKTPTNKQRALKGIYDAFIEAKLDLMSEI